MWHVKIKCWQKKKGGGWLLTKAHKNKYCEVVGNLQNNRNRGKVCGYKPWRERKSVGMKVVLERRCNGRRMLSKKVVGRSARTREVVKGTQFWYVLGAVKQCKSETLFRTWKILWSDHLTLGFLSSAWFKRRSHVSRIFTLGIDGQSIIECR